MGPWYTIAGLIGIGTRVILKGRLVLWLTVLKTSLKGDGNLSFDSLVLAINEDNDTILGSHC